MPHAVRAPSQSLGPDDARARTVRQLRLTKDEVIGLAWAPNEPSAEGGVIAVADRLRSTELMAQLERAATRRYASVPIR